MSVLDKESQTGAVSGQPRKRGSGGHCAKFWWAYLVALVVIVVVVVPVVLIVGIQKIAQQKLDSADLQLDGIVVSKSQTDNLTMAINSTIHSDGSVHANIDPFIGSMYLEDLEDHAPFAKIDFPATTADALQTVNVTQFVPIDNAKALTAFNTWLLVNETLRVTVSGDTQIHVSGISRSYPVTFQKTITMNGLKNLEGTVVNQTTVSLKPDEQGNNFKGTAYIINRSLVAFELGNVTYHNYLEGQEIGTVFMDNVTLNPGMNVLPMRATIDQGPVLAALGKNAYCQGAQKGILPFQIRGKSVVNHGQPLPYFADALAAANQSIPIDIGDALKRSLNITIPCGGLHL